MQGFPKPAIRYMWFISFLGLSAVTLMISRVPDNAWHVSDIIFFALGIAVAELLPVCLPNNTMHYTVSFPISYAAAIVLGPAQGVIALLAGCLIANLVLRWHHIIELYLFFLLNMANLGLSIGAGGYMYQFAGGQTLIHVSSNAHLANTFYPFAIVAGCAAYLVVNSTTAIVAGALLERKPITAVMLSSFRLVWPGYVFFTPFAALLAMLYPKVEMWVVIPFFVPFLAARQCVNLYTRRLQTYMDTISMLGMMTMRYHPYTRDHLESVADWAEKLSNQLRLTIRQTMSIRLAAVLHDVGKIGVGEIILDKKERLSEEDWQVIRDHPDKGARILSRIKYFDQIIPWVRAHHERIDGKGYPNGLKGDEIPFEARIIAVADSYHAMISKERIYRPPMSIDEVIIELKNGSGTQWDPVVVDAMLELLEKQKC